MPKETSSDTGTSALFRIAGAGAALAFGAMVATLFALRRSSGGGFEFEINALAIISFVAAASVAWFYWRMIERMAVGRAPERRRKKFVIFSIGLLLIGVLAFLYPMKFVPPEKRADVFSGLVLAFTVIAGVGFVMLKVKRFLDADQQRAEDDGPAN